MAYGSTSAFRAKFNCLWLSTTLLGGTGRNGLGVDVIKFGEKISSNSLNRTASVIRFLYNTVTLYQPHGLCRI